MNKEDFVKNKKERFRSVFHTYNKLTQTLRNAENRHERENKLYEAGKSVAYNVSEAAKALNNAREVIREFLENEITFDHFDLRPNTQRCTSGHYLVSKGKRMECLCCGASTDYYSFTQEEIDMLVEAAKAQGRFLRFATPDDKSLFHAIRDSRIEDGPVEDDGRLGPMGLAEEQFLVDENEVRDIDLAIKAEHEKGPDLDDEVFRIVQEATRLRRIGNVLKDRNN